MNYKELKKLRIFNNLTQKEFGELVVCTQQQVSRWETGVVQLSDKRLGLFIEKINRENMLDN